jgi:hypothetical protein
MCVTDTNYGKNAHYVGGHGSGDSPGSDGRAARPIGDYLENREYGRRDQSR